MNYEKFQTNAPIISIEPFDPTIAWVAPFTKKFFEKKDKVRTF